MNMNDMLVTSVEIAQWSLVVPGKTATWRLRTQIRVPCARKKKASVRLMTGTWIVKASHMRQLPRNGIRWKTMKPSN